MEEFEGTAWGPPPRPRGTRRSLRRWFVAGGLALAFAVAMGVGAVLGSGVLGTAQAAGVTPPGASALLNVQFPLASTPGARGPGHGQGECQSYTVSSVSGQTIVAKATNGTTVTIHETSSTQYTKADQSASASAVTAGARIHVMGTTNSDGSITATSIDVR
jgi:hypothetical protein